ncbi:hypothetical protein [Paenibacillus polysaccharolyticus]|uniref:hypothetical protein n=1 Tax=Paenibacillus polysaccharolyticus TaxID=582692 RepID=UPI00280B6F89|nr:hypothetical protein [Paenibacillus polysaccharolyticus]
MARMTCKCGEILSNVLVRNNVQLRVYTDKEWDDIIQLDSLDPLAIPFPKYDVWRCEKCERIYVCDWEYGKVIKTFIIEED